MIPTLPEINMKRIVYAVFALVILVTVVATNPDKRNERVECLSLPGNPYAHTPASGHIINTGLLSFALIKIIPDYKILALIFWAVIFAITYKHIDNWLLLLLFIVIAFRTASYQHEEVYFGLPLVYMGMYCKNKWLKGIAIGLSMTVRPVYFAYLLPFIKDYKVWITGCVVCVVCYFTALFTYGESFIYFNNLTSIFRGGAEINYSLWFLDYALLILLPLIWGLGKAEETEEYDGCLEDGVNNQIIK